MFTKRRTIAAAIVLLLVGGLTAALTGRGRPVPLKLAPGWSIELVAEAPGIINPTAIVEAPDGTVYLGQDPMDMAGPPTEPADSVVAIKAGRITRFADRLHAVMGLEWIDGTLYVVHAPYLSSFRDTNGDGRADERIDLVRGLGPDVPAFNGINDHIASGLRLGMDGFLYVAVGDKGIPRAIGTDGATIQLRGGGVIRVRPDGTGLEVVSTGERNPLSVALSDTDEIFTYGNDDDSKRWPNSLTHHIVGGHFGYPYDFLAAPDRALPILDGSIGGAGAQGLCYNEVGLGEQFRGNLFFCDWGRGAVIRYQVTRSGGTYRVDGREYIVRRGTLGDFRPFSLAVGDRGRCLYLVDWACNGFLEPGKKCGRLFRLTNRGGAGDPPSGGSGDLIASLDHPARSARMAAQRALAAVGTAAEGALVERLGRGDPGPGRLHALWALDARNTAAARVAIRRAFDDRDADVRTQAVRSAGIRREPEASPGLIRLLGDPSAQVRREAAIALGRLGEPACLAPLLEALGDTDAFVDWSVSRAIRKIGVGDVPRLREALRDPRRSESALSLCDEWWAGPVVQALVMAVNDAEEPRWRARLVATLAGLYRTYPDWTGQWWGPNPLAGESPRKTRDWDPRSMSAVLEELSARLGDPEPSVRREAIRGLIAVGQAGSAALRVAIDRERDGPNLALVARALGELRDRSSVPALIRLLGDGHQSDDVREAALFALEGLATPAAAGARLELACDPRAPAALAARAIAGLGRDDRIRTAELAQFLGRNEAAIRAATLRALAGRDVRAAPVRESIVAGLDDTSAAVRFAAIEVAGSLGIREAVPGLSRLANDDLTRLAAIRALASLGDPRAAGVYLSAIEDRDPDVRQAAEQGLATIRDSAALELDLCRRSGRLSSNAAEILERALERFVPLLDWQIIGPFPRTTPRLFSEGSTIDLTRPVAGVEGRAIRWNARAADPSTGRVALHNLLDGPESTNDHGYESASSADLLACGYAEALAIDNRAAWMRIGSSGTITVDLNGQTVFHGDHSAGRPYDPDSDIVPIALRKGRNRILVRSRQGIGRWSFSIRVSQPRDDEPLPLTRRRPTTQELRDFALSHVGDPGRGEHLFFDPGGVGCARCHSAGGRGEANVGPDLSGLARTYDRAEIVRSVLEPSSRIVNGYRPLVVALNDGTVATGVLRAEGEDHVDLIDSGLRPVRLAKADMMERRLGDTSLMPAGLVDGLTPAEFADLIAFLESLRHAKVPL